MHTAIIGATGAVGQELIKTLRERAFPATQYRYFASPESAGREITGVRGPAICEPSTPDAFANLHLVFGAAREAVSRDLLPLALHAGAIVIDTSNASRVNASVPLVVPELNGSLLAAPHAHISSPHCTAIMLALVLAPLHRLNPIERVVVNVCQGAADAGGRALIELLKQTHAILHRVPPKTDVFREQCAFNVFSHAVGADGQGDDEIALLRQTRQLLSLPELRLSATCLRVPVSRTDTGSITIEFRNSITPASARQALAEAPGLRLVDDPASARFPTALNADHQDEVLVGRIRSDDSVSNGRGLQLVCAADQLRRGAALNAVLIAEALIRAKRLGPA